MYAQKVAGLRDHVLAIELEMAESAEGLPVLSYEYKCESCRYVWQGLSQEEIGLVCSNCGSTKVRAPSKRGTYKYECDKCGFKWKKKNSTGGTSFCSQCLNVAPVYPYKFKPDVSSSCMGLFNFL